jgi:hypothetical protein
LIGNNTNRLQLLAQRVNKKLKLFESSDGANDEALESEELDAALSGVVDRWVRRRGENKKGD